MMCKHRFVCYFRCLMVKNAVSWCILMFQVSVVMLVDGLWQVKEAPKPDVFVEKATDTTGSRKFCHVFGGEICGLKSCSCTHVVYPSLSHDFYGFIPQVVQDFIETEFTSSPWLLVSKETIHSLANHWTLTKPWLTNKKTWIDSYCLNFKSGSYREPFSQSVSKKLIDIDCRKWTFGWLEAGNWFDSCIPSLGFSWFFFPLEKITRGRQRTFSSIPSFAWTYCPCTLERIGRCWENLFGRCHFWGFLWLQQMFSVVLFSPWKHVDFIFQTCNFRWDCGPLLKND